MPTDLPGSTTGYIPTIDELLGDSEQDLTPVPLIPSRIARAAWPDYDCELCSGAERQPYCYCSYQGCVLPNYPVDTATTPPWVQGWRAWLAALARPVYALMARRTGHYPIYR